MGHWYAWATREYILHKMTLNQVVMYYKYIPGEARLQKKSESSKTELAQLQKFMGGKKIKSR